MFMQKKKYLFHTPIGFYNMNFKEIYFEPINFIRSLYFKYIYKLSRYKDTIVVVNKIGSKNLIKSLNIKILS